MQLFSLLPEETDQKENVQDVIRDRSRTCQDCQLAMLHPENRGLLWRGSPEAKIAVVGEAPGDKETETGIPFVGPAGKEFERWLRYLGLDSRKDILVTNVVQCFPGDTLVEAASIRNGYRRFYSGLAIRVRTEHNVLTGTPNHPVLTGRGWIPLGELHKGDYLVRSNISRGETTVGPNVDDGPAPLEKVFISLLEIGVSHRVPGRRVDFHGDGSDSEIEVVRTHGLLGLDNHTSIHQELSELTFVSANQGTTSLSPSGAGNRALHQSGASLGFSPSGMIGFTGQTLPVSRSSSLVSKPVPGTEIPQRDPHLGEPIPDRGVLHPSLSSELLQGLSGQVTLSQIVEIETVELSEHVYNLETASHLYLANGFVVSNCQPPKAEKNGRMVQQDPSKDSLRACLEPRCLRLLRAMPNLEVIMTLGWVAASAILGQEASSKSHDGQWFAALKVPGVLLFPMVHPAYLLHEPSPDKRGRVEATLRLFKTEYLQTRKILDIFRENKARRSDGFEQTQGIPNI